MKPLIIYVEPSNINKWWVYVEQLLLDALKHSEGELNLDDVKLRLLSGESHLLVGLVDDIHQMVSCAFVTDTISYPQYRAIRVVLGAGEGMSDWIEPLTEKLEEGCATIGAEAIEFFGRPGFTKALKDYAEPKYTVMVRRIANVRWRRRQDNDSVPDQESMGSSRRRAGERCHTGLAGVGADPA